MEIRQLRYFLAVAESGSFSRGADAVHVAQPALSSQVQMLEKELEVQLFIRNARGVELTHAGRLLVNRANEILRTIEGTKQAVRQTSDEIHGELTLGLPPTVSLALTLPLLQVMRKKWPHIALRLIEGHSQWLMEWLFSGRIDAAILFSVASTKSISVIPLLDESLYLIGPPRKKKERLGTIDMRSIREYPLILPTVDNSRRKLIDRAVASADIPLNIAFELDGFTSLKKAVAAGFGYTILSSVSVADEVRRNELEARRIVNPALTRSVVYATRKEKLLDVAQSKASEIIRDTISHLVISGQWRARLRI